MGSSSLASMMGWCRVLALLTFITFVAANQNTEERDLGSLADNSLKVDLNPFLRKRNAEKKNQKEVDRRKRRKKLTRKQKNKEKKDKRKNKTKNLKSKRRGMGRKKQKGQKKKNQNKNKGKKKKNKQSKRKNQKKKRKLRKLRKRKNKIRNKSARQNSCSSNQANYTCMAAALKGLLFEQQQITNYLKQSKTLERHQDVSGNKQGKKNAFQEAEEHLLWAIGGDIDNPVCGPSDTSDSKYNSSLYEYEKNLAVESYKILKDCDIAIEKACNISNLDGYDKDGHAENTTLCQDMKKDAIANNKRCQSLTEDASAQCACWINQTRVIDKIKEFKCQAKSTQKKVTQFKNKCIDTFKECKKKEDKSVESVYFCMHDHSMKFINQTTESLANAAAKNSKTALERAEIGGKNVLEIQEYLDDMTRLS